MARWLAPRDSDACAGALSCRDFLLESLRASSNEVIQHGACLGLGLAALGANEEELLEEVKGVLYTDSAVAGEAAGLALGLLSVGSATDKASDMLTYAHETQHEKIIRGLALGLALVMYGRCARVCTSVRPSAKKRLGRDLGRCVWSAFALGRLLVLQQPQLLGGLLCRHSVHARVRAPHVAGDVP
jgi:hypothetical protein